MKSLKSIIIVFAFSLLLTGCNDKKVFNNDTSIIGYWKEIYYLNLDNAVLLETYSFTDQYYMKIENNILTFTTINDDIKENKYSYSIVNDTIQIELNDENTKLKPIYDFNFVNSPIRNKIILINHTDLYNEVKHIYVQISKDEYTREINREDAKDE